MEKLWGLFAPTPPPTRMSVGRNGVTARRYRFYQLPTLHLFASPSQDVGWSQWAHDGSANTSPDPLLLVPGPDQF